MEKSNKVYMILTNGFDPDVRVYKEAKYLVENGFDVTILCWDRKCEYIEKEEENIDGIKIKRFFIKSVPGTGMKQLIPYLKFIKKIKKYLKDKKYNYLHCHDFDGIIVGIFTKRRKEKKLIFDMHEIYNNYYAYAKTKIFNKFFQFVINKSNYVIYVNDEQVKEIQNKGKLVFLPNYPDIMTYNPIQKYESDKIRVNYIGSLRDFESLKAIAEISNKDNNLKIGLYGTGIEYDRLLEKYKNFPVNIYGKYNGIMEIGEIYRNTDILYCSYNPKIENWRVAYPVKLFEAIITLTPIIVTKDTVAGNFVQQNGIGEVIEFGDEVSIITAIAKIKENYKQYIDRIKEISDMYKWNNVVKILKSIYE